MAGRQGADPARVDRTREARTREPACVIRLVGATQTGCKNRPEKRHRAKVRHLCAFPPLDRFALVCNDRPRAGLGHGLLTVPCEPTEGLTAAAQQTEGWGT